MTKRVKLTTRDIIHMELDYIEENNIPDNVIGNKVHFYNYYSAGLAVLVSIDDMPEFKSKQGNRMYSILKGSYSSKIFNNKIQLELLNRNIIEKTVANGTECYKFIKNSMPLTVGSVMLALSVSSSPSPKSYMDYFKEDKRLCLGINAYHADDSDNAILADGLSDTGFNIVVDKFVQSLTNDNANIMDIIAEKIMEKRMKDINSYRYQTYSGGYSIKDIYSNEIIHKASNILAKYKRLLIMGNTGDGKTSLAYMLAHNLSGEDIGEPVDGNVDTNYYRICVAGAGDGNQLWSVDSTEEYAGKLKLFVEHIKKENITEPCVFICNEIQVSDFRYLVGNNLFEDFNKPKRTELLPSNLYLIFTGCNDSDFGIDEQITQRVPYVELTGLRRENEDVMAKLCIVFPEQSSGQIIKTVADINSIEDYNVISTRYLLQMLRGEKPRLDIKEGMISDKSKQLLNKLRDFYDN